MAPVSGPRGASRSRTAGSAGGRAQRRHILEAGSTGLGDGPSADGGGEDMSKVTPGFWPASGVHEGAFLKSGTRFGRKTSFL